MRILLVCHDSPLSRSYGAGLRAHYIWLALRRIGEVSTLVMVPSDHTALDTTPRDGEIGRIHFRKPAVPWTTPETRKIRRLVAQTVDPYRFDLTVVRYLRMAMIVQGSVPTPIIVDGDDLDKVTPAIGRSLGLRLVDGAKSAARRIVTRHALQGFTHVWFVNPLDQGKFPVRSGSVLPNLANAPKALLPRTLGSHPRVLMVGKFGYAPNAEGANFFICNVLPALRSVAPGSRLRLVGQCPPELAQRWRMVDGVDVMGFVDDLAPEYASASLVVAPVFSGGGTQIKVLEALGHGCGTVVSAFAAAGFSPTLRDAEHLLVARDAAGWLAQCATLIRSPSEAERLGLAGRGVVLQKYAFEGMAHEVRLTVDRLCGPSGERQMVDNIVRTPIQ